MSKFGRKKVAPAGYEYLEPTLVALEGEMRDRVAESHEGMKSNVSAQPVHQITWQRSRYVYDMYYTFDMIDKKVYDYCLETKVADPLLIAKWKKAGYERLCSTWVINPRNFRFGTVSLCRVPETDLTEDIVVEDPVTGCHGCASGNKMRNIFGNKYGQYLAVVQLTREEKDGGNEDEDAEPVYYESVWADEEEEKKLDLSDVLGNFGKVLSEEGEEEQEDTTGDEDDGGGNDEGNDNAAKRQKRA